MRRQQQEINALRFEPRELNISQLRGMPEYNVAAVTGIHAGVLLIDLRDRVRFVRQKERNKDRATQAAANSF